MTGVAWPQQFALIDVSRAMLLIKSLDPSASLAFSEYTHGWYVDARIEVSDGVFLTGITLHRSTPEAAVEAYVARLTSVSAPEFVAVRAYHDDRRNVRWNGAAFVDVRVDPGTGR